MKWQTILASGGESLIDIDWTLFVQFGLFSIMALATNKLLFQPYLRMRKERDEGIDGARSQADDMTQKADAMLADYEAKVASARTNAVAQSRKLRTESLEQEQKVLAAARESALGALKKANDSLESERKAARDELLPKADQLAGDIAAKLVGRQVA